MTVGWKSLKQWAKANLPSFEIVSTICRTLSNNTLFTTAIFTAFRGSVFLAYFISHSLVCSFYILVAKPSLCVCNAYLHPCTLFVFAELSPSLCTSPCGFSINLPSFCYAITGVYTGLSHEATSVSFRGLVFLSLCDAEHRPDSWNFRNQNPWRRWLVASIQSRGEINILKSKEVGLVLVDCLCIVFKAWAWFLGTQKQQKEQQKGGKSWVWNLFSPWVRYCLV